MAIRFLSSNMKFSSYLLVVIHGVFFLNISVWRLRSMKLWVTERNFILICWLFLVCCYKLFFSVLIATVSVPIILWLWRFFTFVSHAAWYNSSSICTLSLCSYLSSVSLLFGEHMYTYTRTMNACSWQQQSRLTQPSKFFLFSWTFADAKKKHTYTVCHWKKGEGGAVWNERWQKDKQTSKKITYLWSPQRSFLRKHTLLLEEAADLRDHQATIWPPSANKIEKLLRKGIFW